MDRQGRARRRRAADATRHEPPVPQDRLSPAAGHAHVGARQLRAPRRLRAHAAARRDAPRRRAARRRLRAGRERDGRQRLPSKRAELVRARRRRAPSSIPFCGWGTVLAVANALGLDAIGVDVSARMCRRARCSSSSTARTRRSDAERGQLTARRHARRLRALPSSRGRLLLRAAAAAADAHARARAAASARATRRHRHRAHGAPGAAELGPARRHRLRRRSGRRPRRSPARAPSYLLFPGPSRRATCASCRVEQPITLVVVDGTWSQARTLVRRQPGAGGAAAHRLHAAAAERLRSHPPRAGRLLRLDDRGARRGAERARARRRAVRSAARAVSRDGRSAGALRRRGRARAATSDAAGAPRPPRPTLATRLAADWSRLVCIQGEANGWPVHDPERHDPEIVHFVACRPATGELYEAVMAPRRPLAPLTPQPHRAVGRSGSPAAAASRRGSARGRRSARPTTSRAVGQLLHATWRASKGWRCRRAGSICAASSRTRRCGRAAARSKSAPRSSRATVTPLGLDGRGGRRLATLVSVLGTICGVAR